MLRHVSGWLACGLVIVACGGDDPAGPANVASIELSQTTAAFASLGITETVSATAKDASGSTVSASVTWTSSDASVAAVASGVITAVGNGTSTVTATAGTASATVAVTVQQVATGVSVTPPDGVIKAASSLTGAAVDAGGSPIPAEDVMWSSLTPGILTVDQDGNVTPVSTGVARIEATSGSFSSVALVRTVWNVQVLADLFPLFEYNSAHGGRVAFSDEDQANADERGMVLDSIWTYLGTVLPNGGNANTEMFFTTWGEIWTEFTPFCSGSLIAPSLDQTNWTECQGPKHQHFFVVENEPSDRFLVLRFTARQWLINSFPAGQLFAWFSEGYSQWVSAGELGSGTLVVNAPRSLSTNDFKGGDSAGTLTSLSELVVMSSTDYYADPQNRTPTAVKMGQSVMIFDYLNNAHPSVIPGILSLIQGGSFTNDDIIQYILTNTSLSMGQLEAAYLAHARGL